MRPGPFTTDAMTHLRRIFKSTFQLIEVDSPELFDICSRIRYEILCEEGRIPGFNPRKYPNRMEQDEHDHHAQSFLLQHRQSGRFIGTVRMIFSQRPEHPFAVENCREYGFYPGALSSLDNNRVHTAEISRLMILPAFRRRIRDFDADLGLAPESAPSPRERRLLHPMLGLFKAVIMVTAQKNIQCWCSVMEPKLHATLAGLGILMEPLGPDILYHGTRRIYFCHVPDIVDHVFKTRPEIWTLLTDNGKLLNSMLLNKCIQES